jgi:hypothetical protein
VKHSWHDWILKGIVFAIAVHSQRGIAVAGPSADVARKCMRYSYVAYPYKRPGSVKGSGDRQAYFMDCMAKEGNVPAPPLPRDQVSSLAPSGRGAITKSDLF